MKYPYAPGSAAAHERAIAPPAPPPAAAQVLERGAVVETGPLEAVKLRDQIRELGGRALLTRALGVDLVASELIESHLVRFRYGPLRGYAAWWNRQPKGVTLQMPHPRRMALEAFRIEIGLITLTFVTCRACGHAGIRATQDGEPRAHKLRSGRPCPGGRPKCRACLIWSAT